MPDKAVSPPAAADPEMSERPKRRTFTAQQKLRILEETDRATGSGEVGAILRREGLYSSSLTDWRRQRAAGTLTALTPAKRGPKPEAAHPLAAELAAERRKTAALQKRLDQAEAIIDVQKKISALLGISLPPTDDTDGTSS
jgi:transposase-like protein